MPVVYLRRAVPHAETNRRAADAHCRRGLSLSILPQSHGEKEGEDRDLNTLGAPGRTQVSGQTPPQLRLRLPAYTSEPRA